VNVSYSYLSLILTWNTSQKPLEDTILVYTTLLMIGFIVLPDNRVVCLKATKLRRHVKTKLGYEKCSYL
jgi:hypothetical protein